MLLAALCYMWLAATFACLMIVSVTYMEDDGAISSKFKLLTDYD